MTPVWLILSLALVTIVVISSISYALYYKFEYVNLRRNFKWYMNNVEKKTIKVDVVLHNAVLEALEQAKEKNNTLEIKMYTNLFEKIKGKW